MENSRHTRLEKNKALKMLEGDNFILKEDAYQVFIASTNEEFGEWFLTEY